MEALVPRETGNHLDSEYGNYYIKIQFLFFIFITNPDIGNILS